MCIYGYFWVFMATYEYLWLLLVLSRCLDFAWVSWFCRCILLLSGCLGFVGVPWFCRCLLGTLLQIPAQRRAGWVFMGNYEYLWVFISFYDEYLWVFMNIYEYLWVSIDICSRSVGFLDIFWFSRGLLIFSRSVDFPEICWLSRDLLIFSIPVGFLEIC